MNVLSIRGVGFLGYYAACSRVDIERRREQLVRLTAVPAN